MIKIRQGREVPGWGDHAFVFWAQYDRFCFFGTALCTGTRDDRLLVTGSSMLNRIEAEDLFRTIGEMSPPGAAYAREFNGYIPCSRESLYEHVRRGIALFMFEVAWRRPLQTWESLPMKFVDFSDGNKQ